MTSVNPNIDIAFQKIFGVESNKDLLISLLNSILPRDDQTEQIELMNPYDKDNFKVENLSTIEVIARNKYTGKDFFIEIQYAYEMGYYDSDLNSWAQIYTNKLNKKKYNGLNRAIIIHMLLFTSIAHEEGYGWRKFALSEYHHQFIHDKNENKTKGFKDIEIHTIELNKFKKYKKLEHVLTRLPEMIDKWMVVFTKSLLLDVDNLPKELELPEIRKAVQLMDEMVLNKREREIYESHLGYCRRNSGIFSTLFSKWKGKAFADMRAMMR